MCAKLALVVDYCQEISLECTLYIAASCSISLKMIHSVVVAFVVNIAVTVNIDYKLEFKTIYASAVPAPSIRLSWLYCNHSTASQQLNPFQCHQLQCCLPVSNFRIRMLK